MRVVEGAKLAVGGGKAPNWELQFVRFAHIDEVRSRHTSGDLAKFGLQHAERLGAALACLVIFGVLINRPDILLPLTR